MPTDSIEKNPLDENILNIAKQALQESLFEPIQPSLIVGKDENKVEIPFIFIRNFAELLKENITKI
jgi:hypothetical protein